MSFRYRFNDGRIQLVTYALARVKHPNSLDILNFRHGGTGVVRYAHKYREHITFLLSVYNLFFDALDSFHTHKESVREYHLLSSILTHEIYVIFKHANDTDRKSLDLPISSKVGAKDDVPVSVPQRKLYKSERVSIKSCGLELILFNILARLFQESLMTILNDELNKELDNAEVGVIKYHRRLKERLRVSMLHHFGYIWFGKYEGMERSFLTRLAIEDAILDSIKLLWCLCDRVIGLSKCVEADVEANELCDMLTGFHYEEDDDGCFHYNTNLSNYNEEYFFNQNKDSL